MCMAASMAAPCGLDERLQSGLLVLENVCVLEARREGESGGLRVVGEWQVEGKERVQLCTAAGWL